MTAPKNFLYGLAIVCSTVALGLGIWAVTLPWQKAAPFDVLGLLWLITHLPHLVIVTTALTFGIAGAYFFVAVARR